MSTVVSENSRFESLSTANVWSARSFAWLVISVTFAFLVVAYLTLWHGWPGVAPILSVITGTGTSEEPPIGNDLVLSGIQSSIYGAAMIGSVIWPRLSQQRTLRQDAEAIMSISNYLVRAAFWGVVLIGLVDMVISFLRVEDLLSAVVGEELAKQLGRSRFRGPYVHMPLLALGFVIAIFKRSPGFHWLALLVVIAELFIVLSRFVFSYEQAFQGDLVRFWYAGLFLFASAFTLFEDGHVRVDVLYAGFSDRGKGVVNAIGSVTLGMSLCWVVLAIGMAGKNSILSSPLVNYEVSQSGFGMYVKYLMAGFLGVFALSMMIQFTSYFLESVADYREDPGRREPNSEMIH
jgi:TRAP-type mannitol/chloroaromatic compound transport system permease small subunit